MTHPTRTFTAICILIGSAALLTAQGSPAMRPGAGPKIGQLPTSAMLARAEAGVRSAERASRALTAPVAAKVRARAHAAALRDVAALRQRPDAGSDETRTRIVRLKQASRGLRTTPTAPALATTSAAAAAAGATISGTVTGDKGEPLAGVTVWAAGASSYLDASATTNADGTFTLAGLPDDHSRSGLPAGTYRAQFFADGYITQYFGGAYSCGYY